MKHLYFFTIKTEILKKNKFQHLFYSYAWKYTIFIIIISLHGIIHE